LFAIACHFTQRGAVPSLEANVVVQLYKIAQEALTNAIKHGKATRAAISLISTPEHLTLRIENNGLPFPDLRGHSTGMGLKIMSYRASLIGGSVDVKAKRSQGTLVSCSLPLEANK
jgi:signal transduction histidine kinase